MKETLITMTGLATAAVTMLIFIGMVCERRQHWTGEHIKEGAAQLGSLSIIGLILSSMFAFGGENQLYTELACVGFMTFLYPFLGFAFVTDWPGDRFRIENHGKAAALGLLFLEFSMLLLSLTVVACSLNNGTSSVEAWTTGSITFVVASVLFLGLGAYSEKLSFSN